MPILNSMQQVRMYACITQDLEELQALAQHTSAYKSCCYVQ